MALRDRRHGWYDRGAGHSRDGEGWNGSSGSFGGDPNGSGEPDRYFGTGEHLLYTCRRHPVVLEVPTIICFVSGVMLLFALRDPGGGPVRPIAFVVFVAGSGYFVVRLLQWWTYQYVLTNWG
jgi:hypothetical protein